MTVTVDELVMLIGKQAVELEQLRRQAALVETLRAELQNMTALVEDLRRQLNDRE